MSRNFEPGPNGYASPSSFSPPLAFSVKIASYSARSALKNSSTRARAPSTSSVLASDDGLLECGLPNTPASSRSACRRTSDSGYSALPV